MAHPWPWALPSHRQDRGKEVAPGSPTKSSVQDAGGAEAYMGPWRALGFSSMNVPA